MFVRTFMCVFMSVFMVSCHLFRNDQLEMVWVLEVKPLGVERKMCKDVIDQKMYKGKWNLMTVQS